MKKLRIAVAVVGAALLAENALQHVPKSLRAEVAAKRLLFKHVASGSPLLYRAKIEGRIGELAPGALVMECEFRGHPDSELLTKTRELLGIPAPRFFGSNLWPPYAHNTYDDTRLEALRVRRAQAEAHARWVAQMPSGDDAQGGVE